MASGDEPTKTRVSPDAGSTPVSDGPSTRSHDADLVQLALRRPTLGARVTSRVAGSQAVGPLAERVGRSRFEARIACECEDVLVAEISRALEDGVRSMAQLAVRTGLGTGACGGARCLDGMALHLARVTGRPVSEVLREAAALVPVRSGADGPDRGLAHASLAYARMGDDVFDDEQDDDEPELVVQSVRPRGRR